MSRRYQWSPQARAELVATLRESKHRWGAEQRERYRVLIADAVTTLADHPLMGRARPAWGDGVRSFVVGSHILVYVVEGSTIKIARLLHQRDDLEQMLGLVERGDQENFEK